MRRDAYQDQVQARFGRLVEADTVHHIYPVDEFPQYAWEDWNLISVSAKLTHNKCHDRQTRKLTPFGESLKKIANKKRLPPLNDL